jgi:hypothetical protein
MESSIREKKSPPTSDLPDFLAPLFWDYKFDTLTWKEDHDLIIKRVLASGGWEAIRWLQSMVGDLNLRTWILNHKGAGLSPQRLRFWELILNLPHRQVNSWLTSVRRKVWERRVNP